MRTRREKKVKRKKVKMKVRFDPYQPLYFTVYTDGSDRSNIKLAEIKRSLLPYNVEVKVKPITVNAPTRLPALFVQDKYFFSLLSQLDVSELLSFVMQAQSKLEDLARKFYERNRGKFVVLTRPVYDKDSHEYAGRYHLLPPSDVKVGFMSFDTNKIGYPVTQWMVESLQRMGVDVVLYPSSHTISEFRFFVGRITTGED